MLEPIDLLKSDVSQFNAWREANPQEPLDFSGASFIGSDLSGAYLMGIRLDGANFTSATLCGAIFCGASLRKTILYGADLTGAAFGPPNLIDAAFAFSPLGRYLSYGVDAEGASFACAMLSGTQFRECRLQGADFSRTNHQEATFTNAMLDGASFDADDGTLEDRTWGHLASLTAEQKHSYIWSLVGIANLDGAINPPEKEFLFTIVRFMNLSQNEFESYLPQGDYMLKDMPLAVPGNLEDRIEWLRNLLMMALADGTLSEQEYMACVYFADQLGFPETIVREVVMSISAQ